MPTKSMAESAWAEDMGPWLYHLRSRYKEKSEMTLKKN